MKNRKTFPETRRENKTPRAQSNDPILNVLFKRKKFSIKGSSLEVKEGTFNKMFSFSNPNNKTMYLYIHRFSWKLNTILIGPIISISESSENNKDRKFYQSGKIPTLAQGKRNVTLTYSIEKNSEITVLFECEGYDGRHPNYSLEYKWLDPQTGRDAKEGIKP